MPAQLEQLRIAHRVDGHFRVQADRHGARPVPVADRAQHPPAVGTIAHKVVVGDRDEIDAVVGPVFELEDHGLDWLGTDLPAVGDDDVAELTLERAPSRRLHTSETIPVHVEQIEARRRAVAHVDFVRLNVVSAVGTMLPVGKKLLPGVLALAFEQHVAVWPASLGHDVADRPAHAHELPAAPEGVRYLEQPRLLNDHRGQRDQIAISIEIDGLDVLVDDLDVEVRGSERGQDCQSQGRHHRIEAANPPDVAEAPERRREPGIDKENFLPGCRRHSVPRAVVRRVGVPVRELHLRVRERAIIPAEPRRRAIGAVLNTTCVWARIPDSDRDLSRVFVPR